MGKTMKKILCSVLVVLMCLTSAPLQFFGGMDFSWLDFEVGAITTTEFDENIVESVEIVALPDKTEYIYEVDGYWNEYHEDDNEYQYFEYETEYYGLKIKANYTDGTSEVFDIYDIDNNIEGQKYGEEWKIGKHKIVIECLGRETSFDIEVIENPVESIEIAALPDKTEYIYEVDGYWNEYHEDDNEYQYFEYETEYYGLKIKANYTDGTSEVFDIYDIDNNIEGQEYGEEWKIGKHKIVIECLGRETSFDIEVIENPVESIEIAALPDKTEYIYEVDGYWSEYYDDENDIEYQCFEYNTDYDGLKIKANYTDGTSEVFDIYDIDNNIEGQEYGEEWKIGKHKIVIECLGRETSFDIEVVENPVESIEIAALPDKTEYIYEVDGYWSEGYDENCVEVEKYFKYDMYIYGLKIKVNYTDGTSEVFNRWDLNCDITGQTSGEVWNIGTHKVTVESLGRETTFDIEIIASPVESIEIAALPDKTEYTYELDGCWSEYYDEENDTENQYFEYDIKYDGLKIKANYANGISETLNIFYIDRYNIEGQKKHEAWGVGKHEVTVEFLGKETSFDIEVVVDNPVESIEIAALPYRTKYIYELDGYWNECFDDENDIEYQCFEYNINYYGLKIKANYIDGTSEVFDIYDIHNNIQGQNFGEEWGIGKHEINVKCFGKETSFDVEIVENPVEKIEVVYFPYREYMDCEYVDLRGAKFKLYFTDATEKIIEITDENYFSDYALWGGLSVHHGQIDGWEFYIYENSEYDEVSTRSFWFKYCGLQVEIVVPRSELKVVSLEFLNEPLVSFEDSLIRLYLSDASTIDISIKGYDVRAGSENSGMGYLFTQDRILKYYTESDYLFETDKTYLKFGVDDLENVKEFKFDKYFNNSRLNEIDNFIKTFNLNSNISHTHFDGKITAENIDTIIRCAINCVYNTHNNSYDFRYSSESVKKVLKDVFACDDVDLTLSKYFDETTDTYYCHSLNLYSYADSATCLFEETPIGMGITRTIESSDTGESSVIYAIFNEDGKCIYYSNEKWDYDFVDDLTGVEIEHPGQNDLDFDVTLIEGLSNVYILIEKIIVDKLGANWKLLKVFDIISKNKDGVHVQPSGAVKVKLPLDWEKNGIYRVYRVNDDGTLTNMNAYRQGSHLIFETDHFSCYVIVEEHQHIYTEVVVPSVCTEAGSITYTCTCGDTYTETIPATGHSFDGSECTSCGYDKADECDCNCHASGIKKFFFKLILFFQKLFKKNAVCACGVAHY